MPSYVSRDCNTRFLGDFLRVWLGLAYLRSSTVLWIFHRLFQFFTVITIIGVVNEKSKRFDNVTHKKKIINSCRLGLLVFVQLQEHTNYRLALSKAKCRYMVNSQCWKKKPVKQFLHTHSPIGGQYKFIRSKPSNVVNLLTKQLKRYIKLWKAWFLK